MLVPPSRLSLRAPNDVYIRVVDVGPGLCTVAKIPGDETDHYFVYDAGHWVGSNCLDAINEIVETEFIDVMILSHSDSDHIGEVAEILDVY